MRCFLSISLLLWSFQILFGQPSVSGSIGLAADHCTGPNPNTDCTEVPDGQDELTYLPGIDSLILVTYRFTNNSASTVTKIKLKDSERGPIVSSTSVIIAPGQTVFTNRRYPAITTVGSRTFTVNAFVEYNTGATANFSDDYLLSVAGPEMDTELGVARKADACPGLEASIIATCLVDFGTNEVTAGAGDTIMTHFRTTNIGPGILDYTLLSDHNGDTLRQIFHDLENELWVMFPMQTVAPDLPGTYTRSITATCYDKAGNSVSQTKTYYVTVAEPAFELEFGVARKADICPGEDASFIANCPIVFGTSSVSTEVGDTIVFHARSTNTGLGVIDHFSMTDHDGNLVAETGIERSTGFWVSFNIQTEVPDLPGTYYWSVTVTCTDMGGNQVTATAPYTLTVEAATGNRSGPGRATPERQPNLHAAGIDPHYRARQESEESSDWTIYPNPVTERITLTGSVSGLVSIFNQQGRLVRRVLLSAGDYLGVAELPPGLYWLQVGERTRAFIRH